MEPVLPQYYKNPGHINVDFGSIAPMDPKGRTFIVLVASQRMEEQYDLFMRALESAHYVVLQDKGNRLVVVDNDSSSPAFGQWFRDTKANLPEQTEIIQPMVVDAMLPEAARAAGVETIQAKPGDTVVFASDDCMFDGRWYEALKDSQDHEPFHFLVSDTYGWDWLEQTTAVTGFGGAGLAMSYDAWEKGWRTYKPIVDKQPTGMITPYVTAVLWGSFLCGANIGHLPQQYFTHKGGVATKALGREAIVVAAEDQMVKDWTPDQTARTAESSKESERTDDPFMAIATDLSAKSKAGTLTVTHTIDVDMDRPDFADWVEPGNKGPKVSILMPSLNQGQFIKEAIDSVQAQTETDWELLIIDGGSVDKTAQTVQKASKDDDRIKWIEAPGTSAGQARNHGLALAKGQYIALLDTDDWYFPMSLEQRIQAMENNPCSLVYTRAENAPVPMPDQFDVGSFLQANFIPCQSVLMRRDVVSLVGGCNSNLRVGEDWEWWMRMMAVAGAPQFLDETTYHVRQHQGSLSYRDLTERREDTLKKLEDLRQHGRRYFEIMREPVSVLMLMPSLVRGGAGTFVKDLCNQPIMQRFGLTIAADMYSDVMQEFGDTVNLKFMRIAEALNRHPFPHDVIHAQYWGPISFAACEPAMKRPGLHIVTDHGESGMHAEILGPIHRCVHVYHRRGHTDVSPQNSYMPQHLSIPSGVSKPPDLREDRFGLPNDKKIILTVSRCVDEKNPQAFFKMADVLSARHPNEYVYVFLGYEEGAPLAVDCTIMASQLRSKGEDVRLLPCVTHQEARQYLQIADVNVLLSATEAMPRVILEAQAVGTPCVVTAVGSVPSMLPGGCLVKRRHEPKEAANVVERMLVTPVGTELDPYYSMGNVAWLYAILYRSCALISRLTYRR